MAYTERQQAILERAQAQLEQAPVAGPYQNMDLYSDMPSVGPNDMDVSLPYPNPIPGEGENYSLTDKIIGATETGASLLSGMTGGLLGQGIGSIEGIVKSMREGIYGTPQGAVEASKVAEEYASDLTYQPRTEAGQTYLKATADFLEPLAHTVAFAPMAGMEQAALRSGTRQALVSGQTQRLANQMVEGVNLAQQKLLDGARRRTQRPPALAGDSVGAAATEAARQRVTTAEGLPVPIELTKGAALRDPDTLAFENQQLKMALGGPLRDRIEENNLQILQNFDEMVDRTGAQAVFAGKSATGRSVTTTLAKGWDAAKKKTQDAYEQAHASPEAQIQVKPLPLQAYINSQLTGSPAVQLVDDVRQFIRKNDFGNVHGDGTVTLHNNLTVRQMEQIRTAINELVGNDAPNKRHAAIMKGKIDDVVVPVAGPLYEKARRLRTQQGRIFENRAIISRLLNNKGKMDDPQVALNQVFDKTILNGSPEEIQFVRRVLNAHGDEGKQAWNDIQGATVDWIREQATKGITTDSSAQGNPVVSTSYLHQAIRRLDSDGRLDIIFGKQQAQVMRDLNDVVKYVNTVPPGTLINNSGTAIMVMGALAEMGTSAATVGLPVPLLTGLKFLKDHIQNQKIKKKIQHSLDYSKSLSEGNE